jgi:hypothetical protein
LLLVESSFTQTDYFAELTSWLDEPPSKDKAFRRYASGVERSLSLFDTALQEWADYISFLARLLKVPRRNQGVLSSRMKQLISAIVLASTSCYDCCRSIESNRRKASSSVLEPVTSFRCASESPRSLRIHILDDRQRCALKRPSPIPPRPLLHSVVRFTLRASALPRPSGEAPSKT